MASIIRIKRSSVSGNPAVLAAGELAYSALTDNGSNGGDRLYIGMGTETAGNAANHIVIGGKYFTDMLDHTSGVLTASSAIVVGADKKIDDLLVDNLELNGNTLSTTNTNGDLLITPNGTGKTVITNPYIGDASTSLAEYIYDTVGGAVTGGTGITITNSDASNTSTVSITDTGVTAGSYGSSSAIPVLTINAQGQITTISTASISTSLSIAGDTGTDTVTSGVDTLTFVGGTGITSAVTDNTVTLSIDSTVATLTGSQTLTNKSLQDSTTFFVDDADATKKLQFQLSGITTGTTRTLTVPNVSDTIAVIGTAQTFTAAQTFRAANSVRAEAAATQDAVVLAGRAGGTSSYAVTITPTTLTANRTLTLADGNTTLQTGTMAVTGGTLAQFAATTSAQLAGVISDETGSGALVFATSPTLTTPNIGAATVTSLTGSTGNLSITAAAGNNSINLAPTGTGTVDVGSKRITSLADPTQATDAATKQYVDAVKTGLNVKDPVRVATTAALTVTYSNGTSGVGATLTNAGTQAALTIDSIAMVVGDRVLVKDQSTGFQNGIYTVTNIGSVSTNWVLTRAADFDNNPGGEVGGGDFTFVQEGTTNQDNGFVVTTNGAVTIGTTSIDWAQFSGAGQITAGAGLTKTGNTIDAVGTANRITVNADSIDIASTYVGQTSITTLGTISSGTWNGGVVAGQYGGTGVNNSGKTITLGGNLTTSGAFATTLTVTAATSVTLPTSGTLATLAGTETLTNKTLSTGSTWNGNTVAVAYGGTGATTFTSNGIVYGNGTGALQVTAAGTWDSTNSIGQILSVNASGVPTWTNTIDGGTY